MGVKLSVKGQTGSALKSIFEPNNLVQYLDSIVLVTSADGADIEHFTGVRIYPTDAVVSDRWLRRLFKQFTGTVIMEASH